MENQGPGLLACDEELFARVWGRVTAAQTAEPAGETEVSPQTALVPVSAPATPQPPVEQTAAALQRWTLHLLTDAEAYRALARRRAENRAVLTDLAREKQRGARSLAAEYFLRSGVRYWPQNALQTLPAQPLWPSIRTLYHTERRREAALRAQAAQEEADLANRYLALADAARAAANRLRVMLETLF